MKCPHIFEKKTKLTLNVIKVLIISFITFIFSEPLNQLYSNWSQNDKYLQLTCLRMTKNKNKIFNYIFLEVIVKRKWV